jgi:4-amino-4-deoxy-L-arabinose transferase-like glycosyltransferase
MTMLLGFLPIVAFGLWVVVMRRRLHGDAAAPIRQALLTVAPLWAGWLVLGTELLSLWSAINRPLLILWWLIPIVTAACALPRMPRSPLQPSAAERWKVLDSIFLTILMSIVAACGIEAILSPPMNFDSLTYHLPRIVFWAQQHSVAHYSTNNLRQMMMSPYAEFIGLHLMVLSGSDALINLIQWFAFVLTLVATSLIARQMGAGRTGQLLAALITSTIPGLFLEASNTKNDVVEAMWAVIAAYWALTFLDRARGVVPRMALLGLAIGAAVLTKGTGAFFTGPAALIAALFLFQQERWKAILPLVLMTVIALAINAGHFTRNYRQFGKISGPETKAEGGYVLINARKSPPAVVSNILREFAIEAGTPWPAVNFRMDEAINWLHALIGVDPHDAGLTFSYSPYTGVAYHPHEEDRAGSPAHVLLALISLPLALVVFRRIRFWRILLVYGLATATFVIFCTMLRWQEWNTRLLCPSLCLLAPALAAIWTARGAVYASPVVVAGLLGCLAPTLQSNARPLWGPGNVWTTPRIQKRFFWMPADVPAFQQASALIASKHPQRVAFATNGNSPDYLLMHLMLQSMTPTPRFEYLNPYIQVKGSTEFPPDLIIAGPDSSMMTDPVTNRPFVAVQQNHWFSILLPSSSDDVDRLPFYGFTIISGMNPLEGPYPQWGLPQVHWGLYPETRLNIPHQGTGSAELYLEARRNDSMTQALTISLNGTPLIHHAFNENFQFEPIHSPLSLHAGNNLLVITYANGDQGSWPPNRAVLFRMLQVRETPTRTAATHP